MSAALAISDLQAYPANDNFILPSSPYQHPINGAALRLVLDQPRTVMGSGEYRYDGNMKRVKSVVNNKVIYNVYDSTGTLVHVDDTSTGTYDSYIPSPIGPLARLKGVYGGQQSGDQVFYLHKDHLGSTVVTSDASGVLGTPETFSPFGITTANPVANDNQAGFTGHIRDAATGLNYMQARYYDPVIGRFLSVDPVTFLETGNPGMFNRYAYTFNDPVNLTDPDGQNPIAEEMREQKPACPCLPMPTAEDAEVIIDAVVEGVKGIIGAVTSDKADGGGKEQVGTRADGTPIYKGDNGGPPLGGEPPTPLIPLLTPHGEQRRGEAAQGDTHREVGDPNRVKREGREFTDTETGASVFVKGNRVVITSADGRGVSQFTNSRRNTSRRIKSGKWKPKQ